MKYPQAQPSRLSVLATLPLLCGLCGLFGLAALAGCGGSSVDGESSGSSSSARLAEGAADAGAQAAPAAAAPAASEASGDRKEGEGYKGGIQRLDTGYDLSDVKGGAVADGQQQPKDVEDEAGALPNLKVGEKTNPESKAAIGFAEGATQTHDFGTVKQGEIAEYVFQCVSSGEEPLVVTTVKPSCGCTEAAMFVVRSDGSTEPYEEGTPLAPGTRFDVRAGISTDQRKGAMQTQVGLYCNDPNGLFNLVMKADVQPVLVADPQNLVFGTVLASDRVEGEIRVTSNSLAPCLLRLDETLIQEPMTATLTPQNPDDAGRATEWRLAVALGPNIPEGLRNYPIRLVSDQRVPHPKAKNPDGSDPTFQLNIYVQAQVTGLVSANPSFLSFGMVRPGETKEATVRVQCHDEYQLTPNATVTLEGLQGGEVEHKESFAYEIMPVEGENALDLVLKLAGMPEDFNGSFGGVARVDVGHPSKSDVSIRFSGVCRQGIPGTTDPSARLGGRAVPHSHGDATKKPEGDGH